MLKRPHFVIVMVIVAIVFMVCVVLLASEGGIGS
jgi:preprotein translocase subunit SecG